MMNVNIFPITKRFKDIKHSDSTVMLKEEMIIHHKCFRSGTIFFVLGWREIGNQPFLILSKGSWQGLVNFNEIQHKIETVEK
jgi:hypothetical protein